MKCVVKLMGVVIYEDANFHAFSAIFRIVSRSNDMDITVNIICSLK